MRRVRTRTVRLEAMQAVELEPGVVLPPGYYAATKTRIGEETMSGLSWAALQFSLEFTAAQLVELGVKGSTSRIFVRYDVTTFVRDGKLAQN